MGIVVGGRSVLLSLVLCVGFVSGSRELRVKPSGESFTRGLGTSIVFTCEVTNSDQSESASAAGPKWYHNSVEISDKLSRVYVEDDSPNERKLYITEITEGDKGDYQCIADIDGTEMKKAFSLLIFKDITFDYAPDVQHPAINTDAVILCQVSGEPKPQLSWRYKGVRLQMGGRHETVENGLRIKSITLQDNGIYTCRAEVEPDGRYSEQKISVAVHIPPDITEGPGISEGVEGDNLSLSCKAEGLPQPEFQYYKDGSSSPLVSSERVNVDSKTGSISFSPLMKEDEGNYTCLAHNDVGNQSLNGKIIVYVKPAIDNFQNVSMTEGGATSMICGYRGDPQPSITIRKVGSTEPFSPSGSEDQRIFLSTSQPHQANLSIGSLILADSGDYICKVESKFGSDEKLAKLTVNYRPRFSQTHPKSVYIWAGKTRNITCDVQAEPVPTVTWLRGEDEIVNNGTFHVFTEGRKSNLQVQVRENDQSWIYGFYICKAANEWGISELNIELIRAIVPDSPEAVNVSECFPTGVVLVITPPLNDGGEKIKGYHVEYFEKPVDTNVSFVGGAQNQDTGYVQIPRSVHVRDTNQIEIEALKPNTTYVFKVKAENDVGIGNSRELTVTTEAIRKPDPIKITSDKQAGAFSYTITWKKPITGGLPIKEYEIKYREVKKDESGVPKFGDWVKFVNIDDPDRPMLTYELTDLQQKTDYQLEIRALNEEGWSDFNAEFQFYTREADPSEVARMQAASVGPGAIVGIVIVIFVVLLVVVDISCYFVNNCGVTMFICVHLCGRSVAFNKEKAIEEGESKEILKQPIETYQIEESAPSGAGEAPVPAYTESNEECLKSDDDRKETETVKGALKEGIDGQKEEIEASEVAVDMKSHADTPEKAPII